MCGKLWTPISKYSGSKKKFKTAGKTGKGMAMRNSCSISYSFTFFIADIFPATSDVLTVLHICSRFSTVILKKKKIKKINEIRCFLFKMAYFLLEHLTEKYYCMNYYMNGQNARKFHPVGVASHQK